MAGNDHITVEVVVSGFEVSVTINPHQSVQQLIRDALKEADQAHGDDLSGWELRTTGGHAFDPNQTLSAAGIVSGVKLFLNKGAGGGGADDARRS